MFNLHHAMYCQQYTCEYIIDGAIRQRAKALATSASISCFALDLRCSEPAGDDRFVAVSSAAKPMADCVSFTSEVIVPVVAGNCYKIRVGGWNPGDEGTRTLTVTREAGDGDSNCCVPHPFPECDDLACHQIVLQNRPSLA